MKKLYLVLFLILLSKLSAQEFTGRVFLRDNSVMFLNRIYVTNLNTQKTVLSNYNGEFKIPAKAGEVIRFTSVMTERKNITLSVNNLQNPSLIELQIQQYVIPEVIIGRFKPTGNLRRDVNALKIKDTNSEIQKMLGLPTPKGDGKPPQQPVAGFRDGGLTFSLESIFDILSGERKKKEKLDAYMRMTDATSKVRDYLGKEYFQKVKIPDRFIEDFLQFAYNSDNYYMYAQKGEFELIKFKIEKYLPIFQKRLEDSKITELASQ